VTCSHHPPHYVSRVLLCGGVMDERALFIILSFRRPTRSLPQNGDVGNGR